ncbi:unnamed protein product [Prunus brigantina]
MRCGWCAGMPARPTVRRGFDRALFGAGPFVRGLELGIYRSPGGLIEA